jgi:hypothetical protein
MQDTQHNPFSPMSHLSRKDQFILQKIVERIDTEILRMKTESRCLQRTAQDHIDAVQIQECFKKLHNTPDT